MNDENLRPRALTKEEASTLGRKGGIASGEARRRKRTIREATQTLLSARIPESRLTPAMREYFAAYGIENPTGADALGAMAYLKALQKDDIEAARFVRDSAGEVPTSRVELTGADGAPISTLDMSALTDAELTALAENAEDCCNTVANGN